MPGSTRETRPLSTRKPLGDGTHRANLNTTPQRSSKPRVTPSPNGSGLPHHESLDPNGPLTVRNVTSSPENKRLSAVTNEDQPDSKRSSQVSTTSTNASSKHHRRKTHIGPWQLGRDIGQGASCKVRKVRHSTTGQQAAVKIISKKMAEKARSESLANLHEVAKRPNAGSLAALGNTNVMPFGIEREVVILKLLEHPNVVRLYDVWENKNQLYLVMEFVDGGELFDYVADQDCLSEDETVWLFRQMVAALLHCHRLGIHHRDLKPENILVETADDSLRVKLADFGMAALQPKGKQLTTACGSVHYAAPEVFEKKYDGSRVDVWSLGIILYVMLTGTTPFTYDQQTMANNVNLWYSVIKSGEFPMPEDLSEEAKDLIRKMLNPKPNLRLTLEGVWNHPFVHKYEAEWGETKESGKLENWIGPRPIIENWNITTRADIDREILRNLRTLWHSEKEEALIEKILSKEPNQEKYFYFALQRHREEQLENYLGNSDGVSYSASDYHYIKSPADPINTPPLKNNVAVRTKSQFSILNDEHLQSRSSFLEPPASAKGSVKSYDPFRASRDPIVGGNENYTSVIVRRGTSQQSKRSDTSSVRNTTSLRVEALKNEQRRLSAVSSSASLRHSSPSARPRAIKRRSVSRSSMISSHYPSSPPSVVRPNMKHKCAVSFSRRRRSSIASAKTLQSVQSAGPTTKLDNASTNSLNIRESSSTSAIPSLSVAKSRKGDLTDDGKRLYKSRTDSQAIETEARKVSTELEKLCEEVFNRSSATSSQRTSATVSQGPSDTPPSSLSNGRSIPSLRDTNFSSPPTKIPTTPCERQLPVAPAETPNTFIARELAETSKRLAARYAEDAGAQTDHYFEVLAHLEQLNSLLKTSSSNTTALERRIGSAPEPKFSEFSSTLPVISEDKLLETANSRGYSRQGTRASTDPTDRNAVRLAWENDPSATIRMIDGSSPPRPAPLVIRKASKDSVSAASATMSSARSRYYTTPRTQQTLPQKQSPSSPDSLDTISEESVSKWTGPTNAKPAVPKKKGWWRRRHGSGEEDSSKDGQVSPGNSSTRLKSNSSDQSLTTKKRGTGSKQEENVMSGALNGEESGLPGKRPGFLGFFRKKKSSKTAKPKVKSDGDEETQNQNANALSPTASSFRDPHSLVPVDGLEPQDLGIQRNWLARFLHIKPATRNYFFHVARGRTRAELTRLLKSWRPHGIRDVIVDRARNLIFGRLDAVNALGFKEVEFVAELFVVLVKGKHKRLSIARFTQRKGAASSFKRIMDEIETRLTSKGLLIGNREVKKEMEAVLNEGMAMT